jgi:hypothetical protein
VIIALSVPFEGKYKHAGSKPVQSPTLAQSQPVRGQAARVPSPKFGADILQPLMIGFDHQIG